MFIGGRKTNSEYHEQEISRAEWLSMIVEAAPTTTLTPEADGPDNLLTLRYFEEMIKFEEWLLNLQVPEHLVAQIPGAESITFFDLCNKTDPISNSTRVDAK